MKIRTRTRLDKLEAQSGSKVTTTQIKLRPQISPEAWKALFADSDIGMTMTCEQMAAWAVQNGYA